MVDTKVLIVRRDGTEYEAPKRNDRFWKIILHNRGRMQTGTATIYRYIALLEGLKKRYGTGIRMSPANEAKNRKPILIRQRVAGPILAIIEPIGGPVQSVASKH